MSQRRLPLTAAKIAVITLVFATSGLGGTAAARSDGVAAWTGSRALAAHKSPLQGGPDVTYRQARDRGSVNVERLSRQRPTKRQNRALPFLTHETLAQPGGETGRLVPLVTAPSPVLATTNADGPAAKTGFAGLARSGSPDILAEPPDPWLAVGPDHVVQVVNVSMRITDRQGVASVPDVSLAAFFKLPSDPVTGNTDPRVIFDSLHGRWLATEISWDCAPVGDSAFGTGYIDFAVSRTSDPTGDWDLGYTSFNDLLPDYAAPGTSTDKVALASNLFAMSAGSDCLADATFVAGDVVYLDWADVLNGGTLAVGEKYDEDIFTPRAAVQSPATASRMHHVVQYDDGSGEFAVMYLGATGSVVAKTLAFDSFDLTADGVVAGFLDPPPPQQPGPDTVTTRIGSRPTDAIWQNNRLAFVSTYPCTPSGDSTPRDCVRMTELDTTGVSATVGPTLNQDFLVAANGKDSYHGGVGLSGDGTLHVVWTQSSTAAGDYPSSYTAHQTSAAVASSISPPELLKAGTGTYGGDRWGDYVGVAQDPLVPSAVWQGNQYSGGGSEWKTWISRLQPRGTTYVPITPLRVLDTRLGNGLSGAFSANSARTWKVSGVGAIPAGAVAVTGNVTVTAQQAAGYVAVTPTATDTPSSSTLNFPLTDVRANNLTVPLSATGTLSAVYMAGAGKKTHLVFDVTGYFLADDTGATFSPIAPARVLDTRTGRGLAGSFASGTPRTLKIAGTLSVPVSATAITGNLTVTRQSAPGYLAVTKTPTGSPATSSLNFPVSDNRANGLFAPLDASGRLSIVYKGGTAGARTDVILDVTGYFVPGAAGLRFVPLNPGRIMDTRSAAVLSGLSGTFLANKARLLAVDGHWGVPIGAAAVTGNLTVTAQMDAGYISASPGAPPPVPTTSTLNFPLGDTRANGLVTPLNGSGDTYLVYVSGAGRTTHLVLDLSGYFE